MDIDRDQYQILKQISQGSVAISKCKKRHREWLDTLCLSTALLDKVKAGGGAHYKKGTGLQTYLLGISNQFDLDYEGLSEKAQNLVDGKETKNGRTAQQVMHLHFKTLKPDISAIHRRKHINLSTLTALCGVAGIEVTPDDDWRFVHQGEAPVLLLIENRQLFIELDWIEKVTEADVILQYPGVLSGPFKSWLSKQRFKKIIHFPDYDGIGLREHLQLRNALNGMGVEFLLLDEFEALITKWGTSSIFLKDKNHKAFIKAANTIEESDSLVDLRPLTRIMQELGKALEQEGVELLK